MAPFFRDFSQKYDGKTYMLTLDGDFHMMYYRTDVLAENGIEVPKTWDDYVAAAKALHGKDMNGDGTPDYGSCISKKRNAQAYWFITSVAGGYLQSQGTGQGAFFDTRDMKPLVNNAAFAKALDIYKETTQYGPPDEINLDVGDTRGLFVSGRCALSLDWGDIGTLAIDPATSKVIDKVGAAVTPGAKEVLNRDTGELEACTAENCPHAIDGVNFAPFSSFGGWGGGVNAAADPEGEGRGLRVLLLHAAAGAVERRRDDRQDRLQPLPHLAIREHGGMGEGGHERGSGGQLSRRYPGQPQQPEHDPRSAHPAEPEVSAGRARRGGVALPRRRDRSRIPRCRRSRRPGTI